jgi:hypothetical protein
MAGDTSDTADDTSDMADDSAIASDTNAPASDTSAPAEQTSTSIVSDSHLKDVFPILNLPREIRDMIYDRLLDKVAIRAWSYGINFEALYRTKNSPMSAISETPTQGVPKWLSSNKQIMNEGLEQLYHQAEFTIMRDVRSGSKGTDRSGVISIGQAKNVILYYCSMNLRPHIELEGERRQRVILTDVSLLSKIISGLERHPSVPRCLTLNMYLSTYLSPSLHNSLSDDHEINEVHADIGILNQLPHGLSSITFDIESYPQSPEEITQYKRMMAALSPEFKKIGSALVLGTGQHTTENESFEVKRFLWRRAIKVTSTD